MKVHVEVPRESVVRHSYDKWKENKEKPGTANFSFKGDGIDYANVPFGPEFAKLIRQIIPAAAAAKGEDVEWDIEVPKRFDSFSTSKFDKETGQVADWDKDKEGNFTPGMSDRRTMNSGTIKKLKMLKKALEEAFASGDFTPIFDMDPVSRQMLAGETGHKYTHAKHPYYDLNQWEDLDTQPALGTWDELMQYEDPEKDSFETQMNRSRKDIGTTNAKSWASIIKNYQKHGKEALDEEAKTMQEEQDRERAERERVAEAEHEAKIPGKKGNVNNQWKGFLKWAAKQLGGDWHDYKDTIPLELFDKVYQYDEDTGKGWYDRDELMGLLKAKQSGTVSDERMKNIVSGLTEPFQMGY